MKIKFYKDGKKVKVQKGLVNCRVSYDDEYDSNTQYLVTDKGVYYLAVFDKIVIVPDKRRK